MTGTAPRQRLFTVAIRDYGDGAAAFTSGVEDQLAVIRAWWSGDDLGDRSLAWQEPLVLHTRADVDGFLGSAGLRDLAEDDVVVLFVTGHGLPGASNRHYLLLPGSDPERPIATAYPTIDLVTAVLDSRAGHVLVIVNACYCGLLDEELARLRKDLPRARQDMSTLGVFVSADHDERPRVREFAEVMRRVREYLRSSSGIDNAYLTFDEFHQELDRAARQEPGLLRPVKLWPRRPTDQPSRCLPNPGYRPRVDLVEPARRQVAVTPADLEHWLGRASGRPSTADTSWYFRGREALMTELGDFLDDGTGVLLVTGAAGTGKSAIIARAVTLSDPLFRANPHYRDVIADAKAAGTLPPAGSIHAAVLARNRSVDEIAEHLLTALGHQPVTTEPGHLRTPILRDQLIGAVAGVPRCTLVVDGVDEADEPATLITNLIGPLGRAAADHDGPEVRLILGVRSAVAHHGGPTGGLLRFTRELLAPATVREIRTDSDGITADLAAYMEALLANAAPYAGRPAERSVIAGIVAERVTPSFLDARLAGQRLRERGELQDPADPHWLATLDEGIVAQLREDLRDVATPGHPVADLAAVLRAAAFAAGAGLPWADIWSTVAAAVLDRPGRDLDPAIRHLLRSRLAGYLVTDTEDGRSVHRLAHELLAQVLRGTPHRIFTKAR